ncbi:hypothetical protein ACOME3_002775 [Neoechinorhynchus agilis]
MKAFILLFALVGSAWSLQYTEIRIQHLAANSPCTIDNSTILLHAGMIFAQKDFFGQCNFEIVSQSSTDTRFIFFLGRKLSSSETIKLKPTFGETPFPLDSKTSTSECFLLQSPAKITYDKHTTSNDGKLELRLTAFRCSSTDASQCKLSCMTNQCKAYYANDYCQKACIDPSLRCDKRRHCPASDDEKCGMSTVGAFFLSIFVIALFGGLVFGGYTLYKKRKASATEFERAWHSTSYDVMDNADG